jgi:hypothetical protein
MEHDRMNLLMWAGVTSLLLSLLSLVVVFCTSKRFMSRTAIGFFLLSLSLTMLNAWLRHRYLVSVLFAIFGVVFFYKFLTGRILSSSLR